MSVGERISQLRKQLGMSQLQLAEALEVSRQAVSKWESDQSSPDSLHLIKLADVLESDVEYLATGRRTFGRRPPVVVKTVETVEKVVERPVYIEKIVERTVEKPVIEYVDRPVVEYVEKPVVKKVVRVQKVRSWAEYAIVGAVCLLIGFVLGYLF